MKIVNRLWWLLWGLLIVAILIYNLAFKVQHIHRGDVAPDVVLTSLEGDTVNLRDFRGKRVLLHFWSSTCGYCIAEIPALNHLQASHADEMVVLAVNQGDNAAQLASFVDIYGFDVPIFVDEEEKLADIYRFRGYPSKFFIDTEGTVDYVMYGSLRAEGMSIEETMLDIYEHTEKYAAMPAY